MSETGKIGETRGVPPGVPSIPIGPNWVVYDPEYSPDAKKNLTMFKVMHALDTAGLKVEWVGPEKRQD